MLRSAQGNLLDAPAEALVNTVNEVGVMGKGIALMFREAFPENTRAYTAAAKAGEVRVGRMFVTANPDLLGPRWIINFPTKKHWRSPSQLRWVEAGLRDLVRVVRERGICSVALPPLGCGNGGLAWDDVCPLVEAAAADLPDVEVIVYEPTAAYHTVPKAAGVEGLTPARALVAELVRRYAVLGVECSVLEVQKLAYMLQRSVVALGLVDMLDLRFAAHKYGPYAERLRHLLSALDGSYLHSDKRLADASPLDAVRFADARRAELVEYLRGEDAYRYHAALDRTITVIDGFESPLGMELLATVDWLLSQERVEPTLAGVRAGVANWMGGGEAARRKQRIFDDRLLGLALGRLRPVAA